MVNNPFFTLWWEHISRRAVIPNNSTNSSSLQASDIHIPFIRAIPDPLHVPYAFGASIIYADDDSVGYFSF